MGSADQHHQQHSLQRGKSIMARRAALRQRLAACKHHGAHLQGDKDAGYVWGSYSPLCARDYPTLV